MHIHTWLVLWGSEVALATSSLTYHSSCSPFTLSLGHSSSTALFSFFKYTHAFSLIGTAVEGIFTKMKQEDNIVWEIELKADHFLGGNKRKPEGKNERPVSSPLRGPRAWPRLFSRWTSQNVEGAAPGSLGLSLPATCSSFPLLLDPLLHVWNEQVASRRALQQTGLQIILVTWPPVCFLCFSLNFYISLSC